MLSKALQSILRRYFGQFITGLQNVELAFWTGKINIQNASFKHDKINELLKLHNIPLSIKLSFLGNLQFDIPWNKLTSAPVEIKLKNVMIVFKLEKVITNQQDVQNLKQNAKLILIKNYMAYLIKKSEEIKADQQSQSGFLRKLFIKILHNLNLEVSNIHIRIQNNNNTIIEPESDDQFVDCKDESEPQNLGFSLGFCIQNIDAQTINANNIKQFVRVQNDKTQIRKKLNMKQISVYWEENTEVNLFQLPQERKIEFLRNIIGRKKHRLLTIDGQILMQRGKDSYDYFFSTSFRLLQIGLNYDQIKQFIQVYQQFSNAKAKKKIIKLKQIDYSLQLNLQTNFRQVFKKLEKTNFNQVTKQDIQLLESIDKKILMRWTKEEVIQIIKQSKLKQAYESKNKRTWLGFLSKNPPSELSQQEITTIQQQIVKFIKLIEEQNFGKTIGFYIHFQLLQLRMNHHRVQQQLLFSGEDIQIQFEGKKIDKKVCLQIKEISLIYTDLIKNSQVYIFRNLKQDHRQKFISVRIQDNKILQKIDINIMKMKIIHEIQFLSFLAELFKLRERQKLKAQMILINPELKMQNKNITKQENKKIYECNIDMKRFQIQVELSKTAQLNIYVQEIKIEKGEQANSHKAKIVNFGIELIQNELQLHKKSKILDDLNIGVSIHQGLNIVQSLIPLFRITLNQQSLYYIVHCIKNQYEILKIRSIQHSNQMITQQKFMQGQTSTISVFKAVNIYHCILTTQYLYFYAKQNGKIDLNKLVKKISLRNSKISRVDTHSFKIQSVFVYEIINCKQKQDTQKWIYQIEQRIFENNTKLQMFDMMEEQQIEGNPIIFIPYDTVIQLQTKKIEIIYQKNERQKILSVCLNKLNINLKQNNLQFERKIDLDQIKIIDLSLAKNYNQQLSIIFSNTHNYFEDVDDNIQPLPNINVLIEGKKKTHPKYTGQIKITSSINKIFINFNAELFYSILYRIAVGDHKQKYYTQQIKFIKIFQYIKNILQQPNGIDQKYKNSQDFQFNKSYFQLQKYKQFYSSIVLFHVELLINQAQIYFLNGRNFYWLDKFTGQKLSITIDKSTDFLFLKGSAHKFNLSDLTGYPKTNQLPFIHLQPYPIISPLKKCLHKNMIDFSVGIFEPMTFINKQRFKNYFLLNLYDSQINYQQQPLLRFIDYLTNQIILFIMQPFSLHKYNSPNRGSFQFGYLNFTQQQIKKMIYQSIYPCFTHLNLNATNLVVNFNSHPHDQLIKFYMEKVSFSSSPYNNPQRIHVRLDELKKFKNKYQILRNLIQNEQIFEQKVSKSQWVTRYLISVENIRCQIMQNEFNYEMYFQRSNHGDKDILLPFLMIEKDLLMQGKIKNLCISAPKNIYNLLNKCFIFNLSYDDQSDKLFNTNHQYQSLNQPNKLIYRLFINQLSIIIPEIYQTVIIIQNCQYKFIKLEDTTKQMEVNGKSLHILGSQQNIISPLNLDQQRQRGLEYIITMKPSGQKKMSAFIRQIDLHYNQTVLTPLFKYFLLDDSCYPKQDVYTDLPLITCDVYLLNSYLKIAENDENVYALKGDIKVIWTRYQQPHPQTYKQNRQNFPRDKNGSSYDIQFKGVNFRKYNKKAYTNLSSIKQGNFYRSLSSSMVFNINLTNIMKINNNITYSDMIGYYQINSLCLKLSYKDYLEITNHFSKKNQNQPPPPPPPEPTYTSHSKHKININKLSLQFGLSELPVPLLDITFERSQIDIQLIGKTNVLTTKMQLNINYWNMIIGRWQPLVQRSTSQVTLKAGQFQKYLMATSNKPLYLNFSVEAIKVIQLLSKDMSLQGNLHVINKQQRAKGMQISPYVITNRTGYSIIVNSDFTITTKLRNNEKMHLQNRSIELDQNFSLVNYQIQGDSNIYQLNLNTNQVQKPVISFNHLKYRLIISAIATPVLKQIIISSAYIIHNRTKYPLILTVNQKDYKVDAQSKFPIPFTQQILQDKSLHLQFQHLQKVNQNYSFNFKDILKGYQHYIIYGDYQSFNCLVNMETLNQNTITISPLVTFINLLPLDIKMELALTKINKQKVVIYDEIQVNKQKLFYEFGSKDEVYLRIHIKGFNYSQFINMNLSNDKQLKQINNNIIFVDCRGLQAEIRSKIIKKNKLKYIYIYADSILVNQSDYKYYVFNQNQLLAGQRLKGIAESDSKYVLLGQTLWPQICFNEQNPSESKKFSTEQIGDHLLKVNFNNQLYELVVNNSMNCLYQQAKIFTKIVKIVPRFIFTNKCRRQLSIQQLNTDQRFILKVGQRKDWYWHHHQQMRSITITAIDNEFELPNGWDYSSPISLQKIEQTIFVIRPKSKNADRLLLKIQTLKQNQQIFIIFKQLIQKQDSFIKIQNNVKLVNLQIYQQFLNNINQPWIQYKYFICNSLKQIDFGWDYPEQQHKIVVSFQFIGPYRSKFNNDIITINIDKMNKPQAVQFKGDNDQVLVINVSIEIIGRRKIIIFQNLDESQQSHYQDQDLLQQMSGNKIGISFSQIGISVIGGKERRSQIVYMSIRKLDLIMTEKQMKRNYELKIKYINIDNNLNHNTMYPVLFTPLKYNKTLHKTRPFFICLIEQNLKTKQITQLNYFRMCIQPISLKIYDQMVTKLYDFQNAFSNQEKQKQHVDINKLFRAKQIQYQWQIKQISKQGSIFIRQIQIGKIIVELSFSIRPTFSGNIIIYTILALFKSALSNVSQSQMKLNRFLDKNLSIGQVINQLSQFYKRQIFKEIYKIAGSINLLGNPYVLVKYLAEGTWEIVNQPSQGFIKGPIEGAIGIGKGGVYFLRNLIAGTFNSFEVISESCSRGVASITFDEKFITRRQKIQMQKSKQLIQGTKSAMWALWTGCELAITGIVRHPKQQKKKLGTAGIFKGLALGLTGLFTKPVSGLFEAISKFSQGIKQTALFFQDGPNSTRSRPPRVFLSNQQYYTQYNMEQSKAINLLQFHSTKHLQKTILLVAVDRDNQDCIYTVLTSQYMVQLSKNNKKIIKQIKLTDIDEVEPDEFGGKRGIRIRHRDTETIVVTQKHRQLFECFKEIFARIDEQFDNEQYEQM